MTDSDALAVDQHSHNVETVELALASVTIDPRCCGARQFTLLTPVDRFDRITEVGAVPRFDFHESDQSTALDNEIDIAAPRAEAALKDAPPCPLEPARRDTLAQYTEARSLL